MTPLPLAPATAVATPRASSVDPVAAELEQTFAAALASGVDRDAARRQALNELVSAA